MACARTQRTGTLLAIVIDARALRWCIVTMSYYTYTGYGMVYVGGGEYAYKYTRTHTDRNRVRERARRA